MQNFKMAATSLIFAALLVSPLSAQSTGQWAITPATKTYPVDPSTTAKLKSTTEPTAALVLSAKPEHLSMPEHDVTALAIYLDIGDDDFQIEPTRWGKICKKRTLNGNAGAGQVCTTGMISPAGIEVELVFDGGKSISDLWTAGTGAAFMPSNGSREFTKTQLLDRLQGAKKLVISYTLHGGVHKSATFDLTGASAIVASLCPGGCTL
jgi:hypothetical protein